MRILLVSLVVAVFGVVSAHAQSCPNDDPNSLEAPGISVLRGTLIYHDELRQWLGLRLDRPVCGETEEVQLVFTKAEDSRRAESLRDCEVKATGILYNSPTGYYSAEMAVSEPRLEPDASCNPHPVRPDPEATPIPPDIKTFHGSIVVDYRGKGHVDVKVWQGESEHAPLKPWQAYVHYLLTGGADVIWFGCQQDFQISDISQTPKPPKEVFAGEPDAGTALQDLNGTNTITFTCKRPTPEADATSEDVQSTPPPEADHDSEPAQEGSPPRTPSEPNP
jgi:hypothetical protein